MADVDDLDDLDDVLDQFSPQSPQAPSAPPPTATQPTFTGRPRTNTRVDAPPVPGPGNGLAPLGEEEDALAADFAKELAKGMETLMREIAAADQGETAQGGEGDKDADEEAKRFKAAWEAMLVEEMDGLSTGAGTSADGAAPSTDDFQAKIRAAMSKVNEGESTLKDVAGTGAAADPDSLEALMAQLNDLGGADLPESEAELAGFLETMMGELMSKDVLYEPLTELADKFPPYIASHSPTSTPPLTDADKTRYESQLARVRDILAIFDAPDFSDEDKEKRERVVALMAEMQSFGSPPPELMGPLPPGLSALGGLGAGAGEEGCVLC
ncbi:Pex19 protein family-domain-containing protein [Mycena sanguinolenta]|nr:Pex19 protein family-domain-containing protein [Mycena sanguinolenta]